jgi:hypothetical protein
VVTPFEMPADFDFKALRACSKEYANHGKSRRFYILKAQYSRSANDALRAEWAKLGEKCKRYGFGRHQLEPVQGNAQQISRYVAGYLTKFHKNLRPEDKGARRVRFHGFRKQETFAPDSPVFAGQTIKASHRVASADFSWNTPGAAIWRAQVATWAKAHGYTESDLWSGSRRHEGTHWEWVEHKDGRRTLEERPGRRLTRAEKRHPLYRWAWKHRRTIQAADASTELSRYDLPKAQELHNRQLAEALATDLNTRCQHAKERQEFEGVASRNQAPKLSLGESVARDQEYFAAQTNGKGRYVENYWADGRGQWLWDFSDQDHPLSLFTVLAGLGEPVQLWE